MTLHIISDALQERVTAHLSQFGTLARSVLWTGKGSIVVHFSEPITTSATDTRFAPLTVNWSATFRSPDGAIYLNVPASWRKADREAGEGEANVTAKLTPLMDELLHFLADGFVAIEGRCEAVFGDRKYGFAANSLTGLIKRVLVDKVGDMERYVINAAGRAAINRPEQPAPIADPTTPIPVNELENADEPHDDIGTLVSDEAPLTVPDAAIVEAATEPAFNPIYCDYNGRLLRVNDWVETLIDHPYPISKGSQGGVLGFKKGRVVVGFPDRVANDELAHFPEYLACNLKRIDPPAPKDDPINYDAYNGGLADAALNALVQNDIERTSKVEPYAWATPERRAEVAPIIEKLMPIDLYPSKTEGVWQIEDAVTEKTMRRGLSKFNVVNLSVEEDEMDGEPYTIARFSIGKALDTPYPSKRQTKPAADAPSIHAQYDALHDTLPAATQLLIQANGDEWLAFQMDAMLLRRYAPLCRFTAQTINQAGEQWDKLVIPAGVLDELVTLATEGGLTVALASIVRDEPGKLPIREVTEIHRPNEPIQYLGKEEPPTEWETEADAEAQPELNNFVSALIRTYFEPAALEPTSEAPQSIPAPSALVMTPELQAAKIRLHIHGGLRLGRLGICRQLDRHEIPGQWFDVFFIHPIKPYIVEALEADYDIERASGHIVTLRPKQAAPIGDVQVQADAVVSAFSNASAAVETLATAFTDAQARMDEFTGAAQAADGPELLDEADEADLIEVLRLEHADIAEAALGVTQFLLNVIARLRTTATVAAPY